MLTLSCALFAGILKLLTIFLFPSISQLFNMPVNQSQHPSLHLLNVLRTFYINFNILVRGIWLTCLLCCSSSCQDTGWDSC
ncbi:hypothetical protein B0H16DRAFT_1625486 [Mycena metata]|uniref:Uncharacterized protein n=1 Tax=Mycena metata TaxID=1033252 RepID=A0AAD7H4S0_9AGAR|nr:hypothetical protein B0H16DRAFT_1625486 [Mycena metata]